MHPADMIFFWARSNPGQPALIQPDMVVTYRELAEAVESISARVEHYNFNRQEPVAVSIHHPIQKLAVCFSLSRCGLKVVPVNQGALPHLRPNGINNVIFTGEGQVLAGGRNIRYEDSWLRREHKFSPPKAPAREGGTTHADMIFFTLGRTGVPRSLIIPSSALMAGVKMLPFIGDVDCGRVLITASVNSSLGFSRAALNLYAGRTVCFASNFESQLLLINTFNIETLECSAREVSDLVNFIEKNKKYQLDSLKEVRIDGGYITKDLVRKVQSCLCRNVVTRYSSVEAGLIGYANYDMISEVPNAVGFVLPDNSVEIVDNDDMPVAVDEEGRVRCRTEYYRIVFAANNPGQEVDATDVWCYTGDLGRLTSDDVLCISAPRK